MLLLLQLLYAFKHVHFNSLLHDELVAWGYALMLRLRSMALMLWLA
jgi:hypothetical protein